MPKCKHCENEAEYEFECGGELVHVCAECDEDYNICWICGKEIVYMDTRCDKCIAAELAAEEAAIEDEDESRG